MTNTCPTCGRDREILVAAVCSRCGFDTRPSALEAAESEGTVSSTSEASRVAGGTASATASDALEDTPAA